MISKELEQYYENFYGLFATSGWKQLTDELTKQEDSLNQLRDVKDQRDLDFRQGQLFVISQLLALPKAIELSHNSNMEADGV